jgi:protein involved in polysaccharide export with SLBB domain
MSKSLVVFALLSIGAMPLSAQKALTGNSVPPASVPFSSPVVHALQISAGDLLDLTSSTHQSSPTKLRVDEQGRITLPVAGGLSVMGLTAEQAGTGD